MEGDRILRCILNQTPSQCIVKDVENYLKPAQKVGCKQNDIATIKKYHSFSLKFLRCSIQSFESEKNGVSYLLEACKAAITYLEAACNYIIDAKDFESCQLERLIKLLYHFLAYLSKNGNFEMFEWYSQKTIQFCKSERYLSKAESSVAVEPETIKIYEKIFEMHWKLAGQMPKHKMAHFDVLSMRIQGLNFLLNSSKDVTKFGKYFENALLNFIQENRNLNTRIEGEVANMITDVVQYLGGCLLMNSNDGSSAKATVTYLVLLSFKIIIMHCTSKECFEQLLSSSSGTEQKPNLNSLFLLLIEAHKTNVLLRKFSGSKLCKELCKQARFMKQHLQGFELIHEELLKSKLLIENPKITIIYDIIKALLTFPEVMCWEAVISLSKLAVALKKHIDSLMKCMFGGGNKNNSKRSVEEKRPALKILVSQWYSFACWCLQTHQAWLNSKDKSVGDAKCSCINKSQWKREELLGNCITILESAITALKTMENNKIDFKASEYHWLGVMSYNLGIIAQKEASLKSVVTFIELSISNLKLWVKNGDGDFLASFQQANLILKQKVLIDVLLKVNLKEKALRSISEFIVFLLEADDACLEETIRTIARDQVSFWITTREKIYGEELNDNAARVLSIELDKISGFSLTSSSLKFIIESDMKELVKRKSSSCTRNAKELLDFVTAKFTGNDNLMIAWLILEYLSLQDIDLQQRIALCQNAKTLIEQTFAEKYHPSWCEDLFAMCCFYLGCCEQKCEFLESNKSDELLLDEISHESQAKVCQSSKLKATSSKRPGYISHFDTAINAWARLIQAVFRDTSKSAIKETFKSPEKTAQCLFYIGSVYCLRHQPFKSIRAFHLSNLLMTRLDTSDAKDILELRTTVSCEPTRLLVDLFDLPSAIAVLGNAPVNSELDTYSSTQLQVTKAIVLTKAGEFQSATSILEAVLSDDWINQKTQRSFFQKADSMLTLALSMESPSRTSAKTDHPLVLAQEALKILRSLVARLFVSKNDAKRSENQTNVYWTHLQDSSSLSPWIILSRLLDCLHYIVQRYRFQGCIPEARCHIKEALLLCQQFALHERRLQFLAEEAEASLVSHETEKAEKCLHDISNCLASASLGSGSQHSVPTINDHEDDCTCNYCSDVFLTKICIHCMLSRRACALLSSKNMNDQKLTDEAVSQAIAKALYKAKSAFDELRSSLEIAKEKRRKKVTFDDGTNISIESELRTMIKNDTVFSLSTGDISELLYFNDRIELHCLDCKGAQCSQKTTMLEKTDEVINDLRKRKIFPFITVNHGVMLAKLLQNRVQLYLSNEPGFEAISYSWLPTKVERSGTVNYSTCSENITTTRKTNQSGAARGRKQRTSRKGTRSKKKDEEPQIIVEDTEKLQLERAIEDLRRTCNEALSYLVPNVHCLQIKVIYQLLSIITGRMCPSQTAFIETLSFSRSLNQQLLIRTIKNSRKNSKNEQKNGTSKVTLAEGTISVLEEANSAFSFQTQENLQQQLVDGLASDWRVCSIRISHVGTKCLIVTRLQAYKEPIILRLPIDDADESEEEDSAVGGLVRDLASAFVTDPLEEFEEILDQSLQSLETEDVKTWWNNRKKLDKRLQKMLNKVEHSWLGGWKGVLLGERQDVDFQSNVREAAEELCQRMKVRHGLELPKGTVEVLLDSYSLTDRMQVNKALKHFLGSYFTDAIAEAFFEKAESLAESETNLDTKTTPAKGRKGGRKEMKTDEIRRSPVILILDKHLQKIPWESISILRNQVVSRMPSLLLTRLSVLNSKNFLTNGVNTEKTFYILNPRNDLQNTQKTFEKWFQSIQGWNGLSGRAPSESEYRSALEDNDVFIYCGHGNGREFLRGDDIQRINCRALTFLIGCSSGKLQIKGDLDARGMALHYLIAGCPAIIANLWDVTDKDIDRFLSKLLKEWLDKKDSKLMECVPLARDACLLPYLIGASPVLYGLPIVMKNQTS